MLVVPEMHFEVVDHPSRLCGIQLAGAVNTSYSWQVLELATSRSRVTWLQRRSSDLSSFGVHGIWLHHRLEFVVGMSFAECVNSGCEPWRWCGLDNIGQFWTIGRNAAHYLQAPHLTLANERSLRRPLSRTGCWLVALLMLHESGFRWVEAFLEAVVVIAASLKVCSSHLLSAFPRSGWHWPAQVEMHIQRAEIG